VDTWHRRDRTRTERYGKGKRWQAVYTDGRGREQKRSFTTKDAATGWLREHDGNTREPVTVAEYAETWLARQAHHRDSTAQSVTSRVRTRVIPTLGERLMHEVTRGHVQDAVLEWFEDLSASTVRTTYQNLAAMFHDAALDDVVDATPCVRIRLPRAGQAPAKLLTVAQVQQIADTITPALRPAVVVAAATGLRPSEWRGLTADRVNLRKGLVRVDRQLLPAGGFGPPKNEPSDRTVAVGPATVEVLEDLCKAPGEDGLLFHQGGRRWHIQSITKAWRTMREELPWVGSGWHQLRHHHASVLLSSGASIVAVSHRLGHKDATETLATYAHVMPQDDSRMVGLSDGLVRLT
jgi:integrase